MIAALLCPPATSLPTRLGIPVGELRLRVSRVPLTPHLQMAANRSPRVVDFGHLRYHRRSALLRPFRNGRVRPDRVPMPTLACAFIRIGRSRCIGGFHKEVGSSRTGSQIDFDCPAMRNSCGVSIQNLLLMRRGLADQSILLSSVDYFA